MNEVQNLQHNETVQNREIYFKKTIVIVWTVWELVTGEENES